MSSIRRRSFGHFAFGSAEDRLQRHLVPKSCSKLVLLVASIDGSIPSEVLQLNGTEGGAPISDSVPGGIMPCVVRFCYCRECDNNLGL